MRKMTTFSTESGAVYTYDGVHLIRKGKKSVLIDYDNSPDGEPLAATLMGEIAVGQPATFHLTGIEGHPYRVRVTTTVMEVTNE